MKLLKKKKSEEQRLREDGDLTQMDSLLLDMPQVGTRSTGNGFNWESSQLGIGSTWDRLN